MTLRLYDTMRRALVDFVPLAPPRVTLYTCGPTVYNYAHVGNFRTFLFEDLLRRWLEARGHDVFHVMNLTDVDDKTIKGALAAGRPLREHVERFITAFHEDRDWLGILPPLASWGNMLTGAQHYMWIAPRLAVYPGLMILLAVLSFNAIGDLLRDVLDPRQGAGR